MKNQWNQFPFVLRRKILLTFLAGLASIALSLIIFIITTDHTLEHLTRQGPGPQWKQYAVCANKDLLERICRSQPRPDEWRVRLSVQRMKKEAA